MGFFNHRKNLRYDPCQKSCIKSMTSIGLNVIVVEPNYSSKGLVTNLEKLHEIIKEFGDENILAIHSTISCFAPRQPDSIEKVAQVII